MAEPAAIVEEEVSHSELPPSSADKWFHCGAWRRLNAGLPDQSSAAAEEGTRAHAWLEGHLLGTKDLKDCDEEGMYDHLMAVAEWIEDQPGDKKNAEQKVDYGQPFGWIGLTGTSDLIIEHAKHLTVGDLKYGKMVVEVEDNLQMLIYLVGAVHQFGRRPRYRLVILQPRAYHERGPIREWWISDEDLQAFEAELDKAIARNYDPKSKGVPGDWCRHFCKALGRCTAARDASLARLAAFQEEEE